MTTEQYSIGYDAGYQDGFDAALAEQDKQEPIGYIDDMAPGLIHWTSGEWPNEGTKLYAAQVSVEAEWIETNKALAKEIIELKKQAEQRSDSEQMEPVAYLVTGPYEKHAFADIGSAEAYCRGLNKGFGDAAYSVSPLYAAPVAKAIRAEALEEAAEWCDRLANNGSLDAEDCAAPIRGLK